MKKRLLITSIVMMLVVAVALSTATYAWFTSNTSVSASSIALTANTSASTALGIGWGTYNENTSEAGTELVATVAGTLDPMAPKALTVGTTTFDADDSNTDIAFYSSTIKNINSRPVFNSTPGSASTPLVFKNSSDVNKFFIKNLSPANDLTSVIMTATVSQIYSATAELEGAKYDEKYDYFTRSGEAGAYEYEAVDVTGYEDGVTDVEGKFKAPKNAENLVRIAVFKYDAEDDEEYELLTVMSKLGTENTVYGTIESDRFADVNGNAATVNGTVYAASDMHYYSGTKTAWGTGIDITESAGLAAQGVVDLAVVAWLDGEALTDTYAGYAATVSFNFAQGS